MDLAPCPLPMLRVYRQGAKADASAAGHPPRAAPARDAPIREPCKRLAGERIASDPLREAGALGFLRLLFGGPYSATMCFEMGLNHEKLSWGPQ